MDDEIMWGPAPDKRRMAENQVVYLVAFHYPCRDGFGAAWAASLNLPRDHTWFMPCNYTDPAWGCVDDRGLSVEEAFEDWSVFDGKSVLICDFSFPVDVLVAIAKRAESVHVFDHHLKFRQNLSEAIHLPELPASKEDPPLQVPLPHGWPTNLHITYHDFRCGSLLTYDWFSSENMREGKPYDDYREFFEYLDDRDRWVWEKSQSMEFHAAMDIVENSFEAWDKFVPRFLYDPDSRNSFYGTGLLLLQNKVRRCRSRAEKAFTTRFKGVPADIPTVNAAEDTSETGQAMLELYPEAPFVALYFDKDPDTRVWSLRSRKDDTVDVCAVARERGGGGHLSAAGFRSGVTSLKEEI